MKIKVAEHSKKHPIRVGDVFQSTYSGIFYSLKEDNRGHISLEAIIAHGEYDAWQTMTGAKSAIEKLIEEDKMLHYPKDLYELNIVKK